LGDTRIIAGAGFGINAEVFNKIRLDGYLAWSTQGGAPASEPVSSEHSLRLWVQAGFGIAVMHIEHYLATSAPMGADSYFAVASRDYIAAHQWFVDNADCIIDPRF
jgi:hypothetical protein